MAPLPMTRLNVSVRMRGPLYQSVALRAARIVMIAGILCNPPQAEAAPGPKSARLVELRVPAGAEAHALRVAEGRLLFTEERVGGDRVALLTEADAARLVQAGLPVVVHRAEHARGGPGTGYLPTDAGLDWWAELANAHDGAGLVDLGQSREGRPLLAMWVGVAPERGAPAVRVLGAHHGDEPSSVEVTVDTALTLLRRREQDPTLAAFLNQHTVWFVPWVNPDGHAVGTRFNANGVDLNRNYDYAWSAQAWASGDAPFSEPETRAMRVHGLETRPYLSLSLHSGEENIGWVWNHTRSAPPEAALLQSIAETYASRVTLSGFWVTNGAAWYQTDGDTNDWSYGRYGGMDFTVELSRRKAPPSWQLPHYRSAHREAMLTTLVIPPRLTGQVTDAETGLAVEARLQLTPAEGAPGVFFYSHASSGLFARVVEAGAATLRVEAPGFAPATVRVATGHPVPLMIRLARRNLDSTPSPTRVVAAGDHWSFPAPMAPGEARLLRPGFEPIRLTVHEAGVEVPEGLAAGAWTVVGPDGVVRPRAMLVSGGGGVRLLSAERAPTGWTVQLSRQAPGAAAWGLVGPSRTPVPLPVVSDGDGVVRIALTANELGTDVILRAGGTLLALPGVGPAQEEPPPVDTGRARDTGTPIPGTDPGMPEPEARACGCGGGPRFGLGALVALGLTLRRRRE